jgi:hypothetical protein
MNYEKPNNENENLSADDQRLGEMCRALKKVEAPKDFDFKLKARIAGAQPADFQPRFGWALRYALPALGLILILGLFVYNGGFLSFSNNSMVAQGSNPPPNTALPQNNAVAGIAPHEASAPSENSAALPAVPNLPKVPEKATALRNPEKTGNAPLGKPRNGSSSNSVDIAVRDLPLIQPDNFVKKSEPQNLPANQESSPISVKEILSIMGINVELENGKWKVRSVTANGVGESSGVRADDIVEAIDEQPLSSETVFNKIVKGKKMTVTRKGEKSQLELRNKQ